MRPDCLANMLRISVNETTPVSLPDRCAPGIAAAGTEAGKPGDGRGDCGAEVLPGAGRMTVESRVAPVPEVLAGAEAADEVVAGLTGASNGVAGALGEGLADWTTHIR